MNTSAKIKQENIRKRRITGYRLAQWTWGLPQTLCGAAIYLHNRNRPHTTFHGATVTLWQHRSGVSLGMFLFLPEELFRGKQTQKIEFQNGTFARRLLVHEYGHTLQSLMFGPLYLVAVGLPSVLWANLPGLRAWRERSQISYYSIYPENHADKLGERVLKEKSAVSHSIG